MSVQYLLDTNICIYIAKHRPRSVRERFALWRHAISEAEVERFVCIDGAAGEHEVHRSRVADKARQANGAGVDQRNTEATAENAEC